ncbi:antibiotic ABC transporter ATP-binding protein [bacterium SM23_31]|nr:MAG: antibiotic ABC transporter ATP-binding protein [bacterium SM23_31]
MDDKYSEEEVLGKAYDARLMKRLIHYLSPYKMQVIYAALLLVCTSIFTLARPLLTQYAIDNYVMPGDFDGLTIIAGLFIVIAGLNFIFQYFHFYLMYMTGQKVMYDIRSQIFKHLQRLSLSFFDKTPIGRLVTRLTTDVDALNEMFTSGVVTILGDILLLLGLATMMFVFDAKLALITLTIMPLLFITAFIFKIKAREGFRSIRILIAKINSFLQENITGMKIVQLFNREDKNYRQFERINADHLKAYLRTILYFSIFYPAVEVLSAVAITLIIWFGGLDILTNNLTWGQLVGFIMAAQMFYRPIEDLSEKYNILQSAMASSERIFKLLDKVDEIPDKPDAIAPAYVRGEIEFKNVWFAYKDEEWVLKDISFKVKEGEKVAVVGATGAGKTTVISLLTRFYQVQKGEILIDGINIEHITKESLRKHIGVVLQDVFLFSGSVRDNIALTNSKITDAELIRAAKDVHAHQFIEKLDRDYDEEVLERGSNFSTGQKQLISFARVLVYNPRILVLDEATSNIDTETEILIQKALNRLMHKRTSVIIAHRLSTIKNVERIIVMHKGRIREEGTHQQLLRKHGIYYKLYQLQYRDQETGVNAVANHNV